MISIKKREKSFGEYNKRRTFALYSTSKRMKKLLFILATLLFSATAEMRAEADDQMGLQETTVAVAGNNVSVTGANGLTLEVYKITGEQVVVYKIEGENKSFRLNLPKGCYILRVGKLARKISIC